jgi:protein-disulfide isomerase
MSQYGSMWGVPVAIFGVIWFALVGLLAAFARPGEHKSDATGAYVFALATVGLGAILYLAYASFFVLQTGCVLCIGTYVAVIGIFLVSSASVSMPMTRLPGRLFSDLRAVLSQPTTMLVAVLFLAGAASAIAFFPKEGSVATQQQQSTPQPSADQDKAFADAWFQQHRLDLGVPANGAKVLIVKFIDWQCPSCKAAHFAYKPVLEEFEKTNPGAVRQVIKDYPLNSRCNYGVGSEMHPAACEEAAAVRMAREKGKEEELIAWLFGMPSIQQQQRTPDMVRAQVEKLLGIKDFAREYAARLPDIKRDVADGGALRVNQTPTYFVNGVRAQTADGWLPAHYFGLAIKLELQKASGKSPQP